MTLVDARGVRKGYLVGSTTLTVLRDLELAVDAGEMVAIVGASGVGKSTLLHILGGLDRVDAGVVRIGAADLTAMPDPAVVAFRNRHVGFVFQFHHLLPEFTALDNVAMPQRIAGKSRGAARERARTLLEQLGLGERLHHQPAQMSGGEQQRVAIARALANAPRVVLADEPTGNLDPATSEAVFKSLFDLCRREGVAAVVATHNMELARFMDRVFGLRDGHLEARDFV